MAHIPTTSVKQSTSEIVRTAPATDQQLRRHRYTRWMVIRRWTETKEPSKARHELSRAALGSQDRSTRRLKVASCVFTSRMADSESYSCGSWCETRIVGQERVCLCLSEFEIPLEQGALVLRNNCCRSKRMASTVFVVHTARFCYLLDRHALLQCLMNSMAI